MIPFNDSTYQYLSIGDDIENDILQILRNGRYANGPYLTRFEDRLATSLNARNAVGLSSGSAAIMLALEAFDIGKGDYVMMPNNCHVSIAHAIARSGARPLIMDIDPFTYLIDLNQVEEVLKTKKRVKAIVVVDLFGQMLNMVRCYEICKQYRVKLIEDASHALGATHDHNSISFYSDATILSFSPTRGPLSIGTGGVVITNKDEFASKVRILANEGMGMHYEAIVIGGTYRMDTIIAAQLYHMVRHANEWVEERRRIARIYNDNFNSEQRPTQNPSSKHVYMVYQFCCRDAKERENIKQAFIRNHIGFDYHYPLLISDSKIYLKHHETPVAESLRDRLISLPIYPGMTDQQAMEVVSVVNDALS